MSGSPPVVSSGERSEAATSKRIDIFTLVPDAFAWFLAQHPLSDALEAGLVEVRVHNIREHTRLLHNTVDDTPYRHRMLGQARRAAVQAVERSKADA